MEPFQIPYTPPNKLSDMTHVCRCSQPVLVWSLGCHRLTHACCPCHMAETTLPLSKSITLIRAADIVSCGLEVSQDNVIMTRRTSILGFPWQGTGYWLNTAYWFIDKMVDRLHHPFAGACKLTHDWLLGHRALSQVLKDLLCLGKSCC